MVKLDGASQFDVIVAGGGPGGSACATFCARRGMRVALLDRARFPRDKVCGDYLNPCCWEIFERLGVDHQVRSLAHHETPGFLFSTLEGRVIQVDFTAEIRSRHRAVAVSRRALDDCLLRHARSSGVQVWEGMTMVGMQRMDHGEWRVETQPAAGGRTRPASASTLSAPVVVGADGRHSFVGRSAGLLQRESKDHRLGIQFILRGAEHMSDCIQLHQLREGYCGAVKIGDGLANVCMVVPTADAAAGGLAVLRTNPVLAEFLRGTRLGEKPRVITPILGAEFRAGGDGVLLVGDAARVIEPFTGQGIFFALRSGELAAEAIAHKEWDGYDAVLRAEYGSNARTNRWMRQVLWRGWAVRGAARIADLRPRWMEAIVASVIHEG